MSQTQTADPALRRRMLSTLDRAVAGSTDGERAAAWAAVLRMVESNGGIYPSVLFGQEAPAPRFEVTQMEYVYIQVLRETRGGGSYRYESTYETEMRWAETQVENAALKVIMAVEGDARLTHLTEEHTKLLKKQLRSAKDKKKATELRKELEAEIDRLRDEIAMDDECRAEHEWDYELESDGYRAEIARLKAEVERLKAADPLAKARAVMAEYSAQHRATVMTAIDAIRAQHAGQKLTAVQIADFLTMSDVPTYRGGLATRRAAKRGQPSPQANPWNAAMVRRLLKQVG